MIPIGYMLKRIVSNADWIKSTNVTDIYSVSPCISEPFANYIQYWKHNGYWFFDSPEIIYSIAENEHLDISNTHLFYYEAYEFDYDVDDKDWSRFEPETSFETKPDVPANKSLEGFDIVSFSGSTSPACSPLTCNSIANDIPVNEHGLIDSLEAAMQRLVGGVFDNAEPGPFRIFAVYSVPEPHAVDSELK